jgi:hypothetical protein
MSEEKPLLLKGLNVHSNEDASGAKYDDVLVREP